MDGLEKENSDNCSLGDWYVDKNKLPGGLDSLSKAVEENGMKFGLWFEPEMISPDSDLYRAHPDWCLHVPEKTQKSWKKISLILDYSREEVREAVIKMISDVFIQCKIFPM